MNNDAIGSRQAAILSADVSSDNLFLNPNETDVIKTLTAYLDVVITLIRQHHGRVLDTPEDNILAEFASAVDALRSAATIQKDLIARNAPLPDERKMEFRIGIHFGDVKVDGDRVYGDGVAIVSELEGLAQPSGICISRTVYDQVKDGSPFGYEYLGENTLKNIPGPMAVYRVLLDTEALPHEIEREEKTGQTKKLIQMGDIVVEAHRRQKDRVRARFYRHLRAYLIVNGFLFILNVFTYRGYWWIIWPVFGWGLLILLRLKRSGLTASDKSITPETQALLQTSRLQTEKRDLRQIIIRVEPKDKGNSPTEIVNIRVPVQVLKAGVKLSSFLPDHAKDRVAGALQTRGFDFDTLLKSEEIDIFVASLSGSNLVVEEDDAKVIVSCEQL
jgi:class 3 adenylate cyclase